MDKIICDICGTEYPDSEDRCPVCGCPRDFLLEDSGTVRKVDEDEYSEEVTEALFSNPRKKNRVFDFDEVNQERRPHTVELDDEDEDEDEEYEEGSRTNVLLVVILVILIVLLLLASGFFFVRYFLPNMAEEVPETEPVVTTEAVQEEPTETEDLGIPCTNLMMDGGKMELGKDGKKLLNVHVYPEDTTDAVVYVSEDESVVTVSEDGSVTAVGEGSTVIVVTCGTQQIKCNVTVSFAEAEATVPSDTIPPMEVENADDATQPTEATGAVEETQGTEAEETTEATEQTGPADMELKLKKTDITIGSNYTSVRLEMDCDIKPEDMTWFTMDSTVAIVHDGVVTSTGSGLTRIYGEYQGQQVECIVRCVF